ncbi:MAG: acetyl-CoA hydrolase/transferase family protein [Oligoflexus sp.]
MSKIKPEQLVSIDQAMQLIKKGGTVVTAMAAAEPQLFFSNLESFSENMQGRLRIYCANPSKRYAAFDCVNWQDKLEFIVMFLTRPVRQGDVPPHIQYLPHHLSQWSKMMAFRQDIDVFWGTCSLPDERGFVSLGTGSCYEPEILRQAKHVVLEINPHMPRTNGSTLVSLNEVNYFLEVDRDLPTIPRPAMSAIDHQIAEYVASLVPDEATIQLGIGSIPNAIGEALSQKRHLGVHTEMINDTMMDLYLKGVVTGKCKTRWPRKMIGAFAYGTKELYQFLDRNPVVELHPASVVNDSFRIGLNHRMLSVNSAVEIDLTGQVCSESLGHMELSGIGGANETHIGAQRCAEGRGIVALPSTTRDGLQSKIVFELRPGAKVSISRNDIDTVVTEHGIAQLKGKTVRERVLALIDLAAPQFREKLIFQARKEKYL